MRSLVAPGFEYELLPTCAHFMHFPDGHETWTLDSAYHRARPETDPRAGKPFLCPSLEASSPSPLPNRVGKRDLSSSPIPVPAQPPLARRPALAQRHRQDAAVEMKTPIQKQVYRRAKARQTKKKKKKDENLPSRTIRICTYFACRHAVLCGPRPPEPRVTPETPPLPPPHSFLSPSRQPNGRS